MKAEATLKERSVIVVFLVVTVLCWLGVDLILGTVIAVDNQISWMAALLASTLFLAGFSAMMVSLVLMVIVTFSALKALS